MNNISYEIAMGKLENIIRDLQNDALPIDQLISKAAEAKKLVALCRTKLRDTEAQLNSLLTEEE